MGDISPLRQGLGFELSTSSVYGSALGYNTKQPCTLTRTLYRFQYYHHFLQKQPSDFPVRNSKQTRNIMPKKAKCT